MVNEILMAGVIYITSVSRRFSVTLLHAPFEGAFAMMIAADFWLFCLALVFELAYRAPLIDR
jgi:hypothetical protein